MNWLKTAGKRLLLVATICGTWLAVVGTAWAAPAAKTEEKSTAGYWVFPYFIVLLSIALGMLVVCRTARRSDRARPQSYEQLKTQD
jgi:uncharacterized membrane protein AbrB (regulator of aidB expression)